MKALLLVDIQNDFMPGGPLAVPDGDTIVAEVNRILPRYGLVAAVQDWHPPDHLSFASQHPGRRPLETVDLHGLEQILWPDHCIQGSEGATFHPDLDLKPVEAIFRKGVDREVDSYSGFHDNGKRRGTGLDAWLRAKGADSVDIAGLAAEICVAFTAEDALGCGFAATVLERATRPLDPSDWEEKKAALKAAGVRIAVD